MAEWAPDHCDIVLVHVDIRFAKFPAAIMHSIALHTRVSEPTTKIRMKIDPYYQRQKCSQGILVSSKVSSMRIFEGVRWRGGVK